MGMFVFAIATLIPAILLGIASATGGLWPLLAILALWLFKAAQTPLAIFADPDGDPDIGFPASAEHSTLLAVLHFALLIVVLWALGGTSGLNGLERLGILIAAALYYAQISHPNALELIHSDDRLNRWTGRAIFSSLCYGHFASAFPLVHDVHTATDADPYSARTGEGFYAYAVRATLGSFRAGLAAENRRRKRNTLATDTPKPSRYSHPYVGYILGATLALIAAAIIAGIGGILALIILATLTQVQLLLANYIRHFGLRRALTADGTPLPLGPEHRWAMTTRLSEALTLFALRLSGPDESAGQRVRDTLSAEKISPKLPHSPQMMMLLALIPGKFHNTINPVLASLLPNQPELDPFTRLSPRKPAPIEPPPLESATPNPASPPRPNAPAQRPIPSAAPKAETQDEMLARLMRDHPAEPARKTPRPARPARPNGAAIPGE